MNTVADTSHQVDHCRQLIDRALDRYSTFDADCPQPLAAAIRYMLLAPGKRIRPLLTLFAADCCGGSLDEALPAACAVEMIHTYSLIHDDLPSMDDDDFRRGQPSCHKQFDEATAILAGDALQARAFEILAADVHRHAAECCAALARAAGASKLVGGQVDDLQRAHQPQLASLERLQQIHQRKTAALLTVSLELGALIADASVEQRECLVKYGQNVGLAFQIVDDLLDFCGDGSKMGKQPGNDQQNGTLTFPSILGTDESRLRAGQLVDQAIEAIQPFGDRARPLQDMARFVLQREF